MSNREVELWVLYRKKYGLLNNGLRMEHAGALVSATLANINKKPSSPPFKTSDFMVNGFDSDNEDKPGANELERLLVTW